MALVSNGTGVGESGASGDGLGSSLADSMGCAGVRGEHWGDVFGNKAVGIRA